MIKLLLVEDDANLSYIIQGGLEDMIGDYEVCIAHNGEEGLEAYRKEKPDIIVADIEMPVMDGYEMVQRIRKTDKDIPILFSSARVSPKDVVKGYELGVDNYVKKPFLPEELDAHIRALLSGRQLHLRHYSRHPCPCLRFFPAIDPARGRHFGNALPETRRGGPARSNPR